MYSGHEVTIPLGQIGLMTDLPPADLPRGALILANNVSFETGLITKAPGSAKYNTTTLGAEVIALWDFWPDIVTQRLIALTSAGSIFYDIGDKTFSGGVAIKTGLMAVTANAVFVEGGNEVAANPKKLFLYTGTNQLQVLSGQDDSFADVASPASDWATPNYPTFGFIHRDRHWAFMGQRFYASTTTSHEDFTSNDILTGTVFPGEGGDLVGAWIFKGRPFVFKRGGFVYYLDDSDLDSTNWFWRKLASNFGLASEHSVGELTNDMVALNESGALISYQAVNTYGGIDSSDLFKILQIRQFLRNKTSLAGIGVTHMIYYEDKKQLFITSRSSYQTNNDLMIQMDFNNAQPRVALWDKDAPSCLALRKDVNHIKKPMYGAADGFIYLMDRENRLVGASAYTGEFKTGHYDFRDLSPEIATKNKLFDHLAVEFVPQGRWNIDVDVYIDGNLSETIQYAMNVRDDGLDNFQLDTDALGREESQTVVMPLHGSGRRISFHVKQSGSNENFSLASLTVGFRVSADQVTRV